MRNFFSYTRQRLKEILQSRWFGLPLFFLLLLGNYYEYNPIVTALKMVFYAFLISLLVFIFRQIKKKSTSNNERMKMKDSLFIGVITGICLGIIGILIVKGVIIWRYSFFVFIGLIVVIPRIMNFIYKYKVKQ